MLRQKILEALKPLVDLPLTAAGRVADMRTLKFGKLVDCKGGGSVGDLALHIQCAWRIEGPAGIVTGRADLYEPEDPEIDVDWDTWDYVNPPSLQDKLMQEFTEQHQSGLVVKTINADDYGGALLEFENGYKLRWFPAGTNSEDWRIFSHGDIDKHFVICGGELEAPNSE